MDAHLDSILLFIQENPLIVLVAVVLMIILLFLETLIKWLLIGVLCFGFYTYAKDYAPEALSLEENILSELQGQNHAVVKRFIDEGNSATYRSVDGENFIVSAKDVTIRGKKDGETLTFQYKGDKFQVPYTDDLKKYINGISAK